MFRIKETFYVDEDTHHVHYLIGYEPEFEYSENPHRAYIFRDKENAQQVVDAITEQNWRNRDSEAVYEIEQV